jgi:hypothetical protein
LGVYAWYQEIEFETCLYFKKMAETAVLKEKYWIKKEFFF